MIPSGPHHERPTGRTTPEQREQALMRALDGVELGDHDARIIAWMLMIFDDPTMQVIVGLLVRCRQQGMVETISLQAHLDANRAEQARYGGAR